MSYSKELSKIRCEKSDLEEQITILQKKKLVTLPSISLFYQIIFNSIEFKIFFDFEFVIDSVNWIIFVIHYFFGHMYMCSYVFFGSIEEERSIVIYQGMMAKMEFRR